VFLQKLRKRWQYECHGTSLKDPEVLKVPENGYKKKKKIETMLQKAGTSKGCHLGVMVNYIDAKNLACFNLGTGQREKSKSLRIRTIRWHTCT